MMTTFYQASTAKKKRCWHAALLIFHIEFISQCRRLSLLRSAFSKNWHIVWKVTGQFRRHKWLLKTQQQDCLCAYLHCQKTCLRSFRPTLHFNWSSKCRSLCLSFYPPWLFTTSSSFTHFIATFKTIFFIRGKHSNERKKEIKMSLMCDRFSAISCEGHCSKNSLFSSYILFVSIDFFFRHERARRWCLYWMGLIGECIYLHVSEFWFTSVCMCVVLHPHTYPWILFRPSCMRPS